MELCRVLDTLIGDADHIYDLNRLDDQLSLDIKGTVSVIELGTLKLHMQQGREVKTVGLDRERLAARPIIGVQRGRQIQVAAPTRSLSD